MSIGSLHKNAFFYIFGHVEDKKSYIKKKEDK
jgi:hypothetical protein